MKSFKVNSVFLLICMVFTLASCMSPDPGSTQGENALKENISQESKIPVTISNFTKTNGIKREVMGQPIYTMEFSTQIRIGQKSGFTGESAILKNIIPIEKFGEYYSIYWHDLKKTILYEGALIGYDGEITFEKTEKGWRSTNIKLYNFNLLSNEIPISEFTSVGTIKSLDFQGNKFLYIGMLSTKSEEVYIECSASYETVVYKNNLKVYWSDLKEGMNIGVFGKFGNGDTTPEGKMGLAANNIYILN